MVGQHHLWMHVLLVSIWWKKCYCRLGRWHCQLLLSTCDICHQRTWSDWCSASEWKLPLCGRITYRNYRQPKRPNIIYSSYTTSWWLMRRANVSFLQIVVEPSMHCCRYVGVEVTIEQLLMVHIFERSWQVVRDEHFSVSRHFSWEAGSNVGSDRRQCSACRVFRPIAML